MNKFYKYILISLLVFGLISLLVFQDEIKNKDAIELEEISFPASSCRPQEQVCKVNIDKFNIEVELDKNIYYLKPFNVAVRTEDKAIKLVYIDFKMKGMNMGVNRFNLQNKEASGKMISWEGKALLPFCVSARADWFSEVKIVTVNKIYIFSFPMLVKKTNS